MNDHADIRRAAAAQEETSLLPPVDVFEDASGITLYADLPGVSKESLHLQVESGTLTIEGMMQVSLPPGTEPLHTEVASPRYRRVFTLSKELDTEKVVAEFDNGVLKLRIPKMVRVQPRRVEIRVD